MYKLARYANIVSSTAVLTRRSSVVYFSGIIVAQAYNLKFYDCVERGVVNVLTDIARLTRAIIEFSCALDHYKYLSVCY
jgi:hypothetical protein